MPRQHRIGGAKAQGFAALSARKRREVASCGGKACALWHGPAHMSAIGAKGGAMRAINAVTTGGAKGKT